MHVVRFRCLDLLYAISDHGYDIRCEHFHQIILCGRLPTIHRLQKMRNVPAEAPLFIDALQHTIDNPTASHRWHRLTELYLKESDPALLAFARAALIEHIPEQGIGGFFRSTFFAHVTGDPSFDAQSGKILQQIMPFDPERLMAYANIQWGLVVAREIDRTQFTESLRNSRLDELHRALANHLQKKITPPHKPRGIASIQKVALVLPSLVDLLHTPTVFGLRQAKILSELGFEVHIFSPQEQSNPDMHHYLSTNYRVHINQINLEQIQEQLPANIVMTFCNSEFSLMRRWDEIYQKIGLFDPDLVYFVGLFSPLVSLLHASYPVLGLCVHSTPPIAAVDVWLTASAAQDRRLTSTWAPSTPPAWGHLHPYRIVRDTASQPTSRAQLQLPEDAIVFVSVGFRLNDEIKGAWAQHMLDFMHRHPDSIWLLVGGSGLLPEALQGIADHQVRCLPHQAGIQGILACCDIYVNPPRIGGGFSVAEAMAEGLPCLAFAESDGGSKLGDYAVKDQTAYFSLLESLVADRALRKKMGTSLRELFASTLDLEKSGPSLLAACQLTLERFHHRMQQATS